MTIWLPLAVLLALAVTTIAAAVVLCWRSYLHGPTLSQGHWDGRQEQVFDLFRHVPGLGAPAGTSWQDLGGTGTTGFAARDGVVVGSITNPDLHAAVSDQLQAAGWVQAAVQTGAPISWSRWTVPDLDGEGWLHVLDGPVPERHAVHIRLLSTAQLDDVWKGGVGFIVGYDTAYRRS